MFKRIAFAATAAALFGVAFANLVDASRDEEGLLFDAQRVPFSMVLSADELTRDAHAIAVGLFEERDHHVVGRIRLPRHPTQFHGTPVRATDASPALGEHTDEILTELRMHHRIAELRNSGVVA